MIEQIIFLRYVSKKLEINYSIRDGFDVKKMKADIVIKFIFVFIKIFSKFKNNSDSFDLSRCSLNLMNFLR